VEGVGSHQLLTAFLRDDRFQFGWATFAAFIEACSRHRPLINVALLVGQQALRCAVAGYSTGAAELG
jgi:N-acyl-D-aspartate/D-glutamate deacylase